MSCAYIILVIIAIIKMREVVLAIFQSKCIGDDQKSQFSTPLVVSIVRRNFQICRATNFGNFSHAHGGNIRVQRSA
jgi:hypothetical protein